MKALILAAALAALAATTATTASAADLGGTCCADIEERIAELEATTARKGNRKVSLTVYGQVSQALVWIDADGERDSAIGNNGNDSSRLGVKGEAKFDGRRAGYVIELGVGSFNGGADNFDEYIGGNALSVRHSYVFLDTGVGKVSLGRTSTATDGVAETTVANTAVAAKLLSFEHVGVPAIFDGVRDNVVRYDSPAAAGFIASASMTSGADWQASLRWTGESGGFKGAAAIGYEEAAGIDVDVFGLTLTADGVSRLSASASVMHSSGLFLNAAYGQLDADGFDIKSYHAQAGIEHKFTSVGATTLFGEFLRIDVDGDEVDFIGGGLVQRIDAGALDLFATMRHSADADVSVGMAGAKVQF